MTLSEQFEDRKSGSKPYLAKNYDDFNETFWQRGCLSLDIVGLTQDALRRKFTKTFVERQSWLVPMVRQISDVEREAWCISAVDFISLRWFWGPRVCFDKLVVGAPCVLLGCVLSAALMSCE